MNEQQVLKPYVIGLDLGGTNSVFGIVDSRGEIKATTAIKTQGYDNVEDYVDACVKALEPVIEQVGGIGQIKAMGIGAPNGNYYNGTIEFAPNLSWGHDGIVPLADMFKQRLGIPVALTNDANAAAIGEMIYGVARGMKNFIMITLGTGVGSGIVVNGQLVYGSDGFAGELGHVIVRRDGRPCGCGRKGCLETYCSATGVARTARELLSSTDQPSSLRELNPDEITSHLLRRHDESRRPHHETHQKGLRRKRAEDLQRQGTIPCQRLGRLQCRRARCECRGLGGVVFTSPPPWCPRCRGASFRACRWCAR